MSVLKISTASVYPLIEVSHAPVTTSVDWRLKTPEESLVVALEELSVSTFLIAHRMCTPH